MSLETDIKTPLLCRKLKKNKLKNDWKSDLRVSEV
jgi:hypothetical protein